MAIVTTDDKHYQDIANAIREHTNPDVEFKPSEMAGAVGNVFDAGKADEYDRFWDELQNYGKIKRYTNAFQYGIWTDEAFNPKYTFYTNSCNAMFQHTELTDTKVPIRIVAGSQSYYLFDNAKKMKTIREIIYEGTGQIWSSMVTNCTSLENIKITGTMYGNVNFQWCPLTVESMKNIISCLNDYSVTAEDGTYTLYFSEDCWARLEADSASPNGGTWQEYVESLGWVI
jgi:hypothetical protein